MEIIKEIHAYVNRYLISYFFFTVLAIGVLAKVYKVKDKSPSMAVIRWIFVLYGGMFTLMFVFDLLGIHSEKLFFEVVSGKGIAEVDFAKNGPSILYLTSFILRLLLVLYFLKKIANKYRLALFIAGVFFLLENYVFFLIRLTSWQINYLQENSSWFDLLIPTTRGTVKFLISSALGVFIFMTTNYKFRANSNDQDLIDG